MSPLERAADRHAAPPVRAEAQSAAGAPRALAGPLSVAVLFVLLAAWSWRKWADPVIDFGAELYIPWRLDAGDALYRDIAYRNGPLSPHWNALWFRLFGVSFSALAASNLAILAGLCAVVYRIFRLACDRLSATLACWVLLGLFGFSQYVGVGNYNWVTPYQHSQTHGVALGAAMIAALAQAPRTRSLGWSAVAGVCLGLVLLTKLELQLPALGAAGLGVALLAAREPARGARHGLALVAGAALPVVGAWALLAAKTSAGLAFVGVLGNWRYFGAPLADAFYRSGSGLDDPAGNALLALRMALALALLGAAALGLDRLAARWGRSRLAAAAAGLATALVLLGAGALVPWFRLPRALPLVALAATVAFSARCLRPLRDSAAWERDFPLALWSVWALLLLAKIVLNARIEHYGFALALPATLLLTALLVGVLPARATVPGRGRLARSVAVGALAAALAFFLGHANAIYARKTVPVGRGGDAILAGPLRGPRVAAALARLEEMLPPEATLLALPEGLGFNYWLRRRNPSRYYLFLPAEFAAFGGEAALLDDLRRNPADFVLLVDRPHAEFGVGPFGVDPRNGRALREWVDAHYERVDRIGAEPFRGDGFGIAILRRRAP